MKIAIGSDHAGFRYKEAIVRELRQLGHEIIDFGTSSPESCDYPDFVVPVAKAVQSGEVERGIVLGGSGNGEAIACNRVAGVRCAVAWHEASARLARSHNDANVLSLGERMMDEMTALKLVQIFLNEPFEGGRHLRRIQKIDSC